MAVASVAVTSPVLEVCMSHALSNETEEIMGLLLGDVVDTRTQATKGKDYTEALQARIWAVSLHRREQAARSAQRVEISPEQLAAATEEADRLSTELGVQTRVIGWYHSHPHLAVVPSTVDVNTQAMYQQMDSGFVGLIFSAFNAGRVVPGVATGAQALDKDGNHLVSMGNLEHAGRIQVTCFQSKYVDGEGRNVPPPPPQRVSNWPEGGEAEAEAREFGQVSAAAATPPIKNLHKEVGVYLMKQATILQGRRGREASCVSKLAELQQILREEELLAFYHSVSATLTTNPATGEEVVPGMGATVEAKCHPLLAAHNSAVYQKSLCSLLESCHLPLIASLQSRRTAQQSRLEALREERTALLSSIQGLKSHAAPPSIA